MPSRRLPYVSRPALASGWECVKKAQLNVANCVNLLLEDTAAGINRINKIPDCQELPRRAPRRKGVSFPRQWSLKTQETLCYCAEALHF